MKKGTASSKAVEELEAAFSAEGITTRDLVVTINETRRDAMRFSTKTGEPVGADHATRFKAAESLLALKGLPAKGPPAEAPVADKLRALLNLDASDRGLCEELGL